ncbi:1-aminocyclopropane-1-carboxylate oxidase-like protein 1 [Dichanthelium oligosanthes]|uniref:1-aminocyclopropane-1-carboxylate oxidase-like protein 1 n=1 Tax=Dichanthelium oligosanthes TaxID=888268 RepID=A0A1E5WD13_9POAL|nr:1-aminocyclopropane-1-carboxylate oxidase-like protein 1 [Dichanthelium oligosanthes]
MAATQDYDAAAALAVFHESRAGVCGLVQSGVNAVPPIFLAATAPSPQSPVTTALSIPAVDFSLPRSDTVALIRAAASSCGFFHVINHGVAAGVVDSAVSAVRAFHEQPRAARSAFYSLEPVGAVNYSTIPSVPQQGAPLLPWRDTLRVRFGPGEPDLSRLPAAFREPLQEYQRSLTGFGKEMAGLLSEALGVGTERLEQAMQVEGWLMACHYYPPCPEPAQVMGSLEHTDPSLFTVLAQDGVGGLQVRRDDGTGGGREWVDVAPVTGALLGDVLKVVSNDESQSVEHRVVIKSTQDARVSIALFFNPAKRDKSDLFGPLPELVTTEKPAQYRSFTVPEFMSSRREYGHSRSSVERFKVRSSH